MSLTIKNNEQEFSLPSEGEYVARCYGLIDLGMQKNKNCDSYTPEVLIAWEVGNPADSAEKPWIVVHQYTANLNSKSQLRALLEKWRGKKFNHEELRGFQLENMLGEPCYLTISHEFNKDSQKYFSVVTNIEPLPLDTPYPNLHHLPICFDLDRYTDEEYQVLPKKIRQQINIGKNR